MYDKFGRDWKVLEYFLLQRVCNRLQQAIIFTDSPPEWPFCLLQRTVTTIPVVPLKNSFSFKFELTPR